MKNKFKQKAFTLIELLAVIVILALIVLISIPIIMNILVKIRKSAFQDSAYGIMESAKAFFAECILNEEELKDQVFSFEPNAENTLSYGGQKPNGGVLTLSKSGEISIAFHNNEWCALKSATDTDVRIIRYEKGKCTISDVPEIENTEITVKSTNTANITLGTERDVLDYFNIPNLPIICTDSSDDNKTITNTNILTLGTHVIKCSVTKNGKEISSAEKTVIVEAEIKIEDIIENNDAGENGTVADDAIGNKRLTGTDPNNYVLFNNELWRILGTFDGQMKIIRVESLGQKAWDTNNTSNWATSSLQKELNGSYLNSIEATSKSYIDTQHLWNLGGDTTAQLTRAKMYEVERGTAVYGSNPKTWTGAIGLMYPSDYAYATDSTNSACDSTILKNWNTVCSQSNWLFDSEHNQWTITPDSRDAIYAYIVNTSGMIRIDTSNCGVTTLHDVRPTLYLKKNVKITNADLDNAGSKTKPFTLSMS